MTDYRLITPPHDLVRQWNAEYFHIDTQCGGLDPAILKEARRNFFAKVARWGARECCETPKQRLQRLINETGNEDLIDAFNQLQEEDS